MSTRNSYIDGDPKPNETWARCARSPQGKVGVAVGVGDTQSFFLEENIIATFCSKAKECGPDDEETRRIVPLIQKAAEGLKEFKAALKAEKAELN